MLLMLILLKNIPYLAYFYHPHLTGTQPALFYDNYGRQIKVTRPNPSGGVDVTDTTSYDKLKITYTTASNINDKKMIKVVEKNAQGKVSKVIDAAGTSDAKI